MKNELTTQFIPFPARLMSSARTPASMPLNFARDLVNMYAREDGAGAKRNGVTTVGNAIGAGTIVQLMYYIPPAGSIQILAATDDGKIHLKNGDNWTEAKTGLATTGTIRWTHFAGKLIVCNGVDPVLTWDGTTFNDVKEFVTDPSSGLAYVSATQFTIDSDAALYAVGTPVQAELLAGNFVASTVQSVSGTGTITVTLNDAVLTTDLSAVAYEAKPPAFAFVYAAHDRLWGFGKGPLTAQGFGNDVDRNRVFYTFGVNNENAWHDASGLLQNINLEDKMPVIDELQAMAVKDGLTVFFFRNYMQIWAGDNPTVSGNFAWQKTMPMGAVHGDLVVEMPNDIAFFTRFGARTLSRTLQTEQLDVGDFGSEVDPTISAEVSTMLSSDANYRKAQAFKHDKQGWFGFKPGNKSLVFQFQGASNGWTQYDGIFADATAFLNTPDGALYLAKNDQLYQYDETTWSDAGMPITTRWWLPWLNLSRSFKRWANKYVELITDQGAAIQLDVKRFKNYNSSSFTEQNATASVAADFWESSNWDEALWDNGAPKPELVRDHFIADTFSYSIETTSTDGPLILFGLKVHGLRER